jgi:hypothetical protein
MGHEPNCVRPGRSCMLCRGGIEQLIESMIKGRKSRQLFHADQLQVCVDELFSNVVF